MKKKGQTLVEVLIAMTVISLAALFFAGGIIASANVLKKSSALANATAEGTSAIEEKISFAQYDEKVTAVISTGDKSTEIEVNKVSVTVDVDEKSRITLRCYCP